MANLRTTVVRVTPWRDLRVWRDIELRLDQTLHDLHLAIQDAFELDNDHLYAFYMNGNPFDREFGYEDSPDNARPSARDVSLDRFALPINKQFLYLFDFGDELRHHVKVLAHGSADAEVTYPRIVASEGKAPPQHEQWALDDEDSDQSAADDEDSDQSAADDEDSDQSAADDEDSEQSEWDDACGCEQGESLAEPMRQRLAELVPRIEQAIERQQDREFDDDLSESQARVDLAEEYALVCDLFDAANADARAMHIGIEHATSWSIWPWLCELTSELSGAGMHEEALDLARRIYAATGEEEITIRLPDLLQRANREQEAREMLTKNLVEFPEDARVHLEAAELELATSNLGGAESHYREALKWVGTQMPLRERILGGLKDLLRKTHQTEAIQTLRQQEEQFMLAQYPRLRAHTPIRRQGPKVGRNDPCPCGSGKKSKKCCGAGT